MTDDWPVDALVAAMVEALREPGFVRSPAVAEAFASVHRDLFVPSTPLAEVYSIDRVIATHFDADGLPVSSSSAPNIMAVMLEQLEVRPGMRVLEIGAGTGYNAGLLAHLAGPRGRVVSVELDEQVAAEARRHLRAAGVTNAEVEHGDGWLGAAGSDGFDRIEATVGAWEISPHWFAQLRPGGTLVMPLWLRPGVQVSVAFERETDRMHSRSVTGCGFMRLRGPHAGPDALVLVGGWADRVVGATAEAQWIAAIENATPERIAQLRELLSGPASAEPVPLPAAGWTTRLALEEPKVIALSGRETFWHFACGLFDPDRHGVAVFDAGQIVSFGDAACADRLRARLPDLAALPLGALDIQAVPHPVGGVRDSWVLERPAFDLVVRQI